MCVLDLQGCCVSADLGVRGCIPTSFTEATLAFKPRRLQSSYNLAATVL